MLDIPTHPEALLSIDQVAALLGVDSRTVRRWRRINRMPPGVRINGQVRWRLATITEWVRALEIEEAAAKIVAEGAGKTKKVV